MRDFYYIFDDSPYSKLDYHGSEYAVSHIKVITRLNTKSGLNYDHFCRVGLF